MGGKETGLSLRQGRADVIEKNSNPKTKGGEEFFHRGEIKRRKDNIRPVNAKKHRTKTGKGNRKRCFGWLKTVTAGEMGNGGVVWKAKPKLGILHQVSNGPS